MLFRDSGIKKENPLAMKETESKRLTWKDKFKRDLMRENMNGVEKARANRKRDIKEQEEKRAAAKVLSKLFQKKTIYLQDDEQQTPQHGHYSAFVPLTQQTQLKDELHSTFPYIEYLTQKDQIEARKNVYDEISTCIRNAVETNTVEIAWRSCLKKYLCDLDTIKAIEIYIQLLKSGTQILPQLHQMYGNQSSQLVFFHRYLLITIQGISYSLFKVFLFTIRFHRVCQSAKYFKDNSKINKNLQSSIQIGDKISEVTLPKTSKFLFCSICLLYDCNQHNMDDNAPQFHFQYVAKKNILDESVHLNNILQLIRFEKELTSQKKELPRQQKELTTSKKELNTQKSNNQEQNPPKQIQLQPQQGQMEDVPPQNSVFCSQNCYLKLTKQTMSTKSITRRPIISLVYRSLIHMAIDVFSYDPCIIGLWIGKDNTHTKHVPGQPAHRGITCESIFFYFMEEYDVKMRVSNQLFKSQVDYLINQSSRPINQAKNNIMPPTKKRKTKPKFDHGNPQNHKIGCCFHYFIGQQVFDFNCENCSCKKRGFCLPQCQCPETCQIKKVGCSCKGKQDCRAKKCECFKNNQQCIPGVCGGCFDSQNIKNKKNSCRNTMILRKETRYIKIGDSNIYGLGAFAGEDINKDDLVIVYSGEVILHQIDYIREGLRLDDTFYNFGYTEGGSIDARYIGNKARFINHAQNGEDNLEAATMFTEGKHFTVLYAKKNIKKGEELFFDYDLTGEISKNFPGKYSFIKPKRKLAPSS